MSAQDEQTATAVDAQVRELATHAGIPGTVNVLFLPDGRSSRGYYDKDGHPCVALDPAVNTAPADAVTGLIAHEVAHLVHRDSEDTGLLQYGRVPKFFLLCAGPVMTAGAAIAMAGGFRVISSGSGTSLWWAGFAVLLAGVSLFSLANHIEGAQTRPQELRADATAVNLLGSDAPVIAFLEWLDQMRASRAKPAAEWFNLLLLGRSHPEPKARIAALREVVGQNPPP